MFDNVKKHGCSFTYAIQQSPNGLAEAFIIGEDFIGKENVALVLGGNIFLGASLYKLFQNNLNSKDEIIYAYRVMDLQRYRPVEMNDDVKLISIQGKPKEPKSNCVVSGILYLRQRIGFYSQSYKVQYYWRTVDNRCK